MSGAQPHDKESRGKASGESQHPVDAWLARRDVVTSVITAGPKCASSWEVKPYQPKPSASAHARRPSQNAEVRTEVKQVVLRAGVDPLEQVQPSSRYTQPSWSWGQYHARSEQIRVQSGVVLCRGPRNTGEYTQRAQQMQAAANGSGGRSVPLECVAWPLEKDGASDATLHLSGPSVTLQRFVRFMDACAMLVGATHVREAEQIGRERLWPIFVLTRGRACTAHLRWSATHVLGEEADGEAHPVVAVVSPEEVDEYRRHWPSTLLLALPEAGRGLGYARHVVKRALEWRAPFFWMFDDNINAFVRVDVSADGRAVRYTEGALFREALMQMQRHEVISSIALAGFLRSDGTEVSKVFTDVVDSAKIYKVFLLNSRMCKGVEYVAALGKFEDIAFTRELLLHGRRTLKMQRYAYRAIATKAGGCAASRKAAAVEVVHDSVDQAAMSPAEREVVARLQKWLEHDAHKPMPARLQRREAAAAHRAPPDTPAARKRWRDDDEDYEEGGEEEGKEEAEEGDEENVHALVDVATEEETPPTATLPPPSDEGESGARLVLGLVGIRIRVWWDGEGRWFHGRVRQYSSRRGHKIAYDDGDLKWEALARVRWECEPRDYRRWS